MNANEMSQSLQELINDIGLLDEEDRDHLGLYSPEYFEGANTSDYQDDGVLTRDEGFTIYMPDGSQFQITVVRKR